MLYATGNAKFLEIPLWVVNLEKFTYSVEEYIIGSGEMEDLFILLMSEAMSC